MLLALALCGCGSEDEPAAPAPAVAAPVTPNHGGTLVPLDEYRVELLAHESGEVFGYLTRMDGQPMANPEGALLTVSVTIDAAHPQPLLLRWNGERARYEARLRDTPVEGPADVSLMIAGRPERGSTDRLPVGPALADSGVAYASAEDADPNEDEEDEDGAEAGGGRGDSRGGSLRARARRLFGF